MKSNILCNKCKKRRLDFFPLFTITFLKNMYTLASMLYILTVMFINSNTKFATILTLLLRITYNFKLINTNVFKNSSSFLLQQMSVFFILLKNLSIYASMLGFPPHSRHWKSFHPSFKEGSNDTTSQSAWFYLLGYRSYSREEYLYQVNASIWIPDIVQKLFIGTPLSNVFGIENYASLELLVGSYHLEPENKPTLLKIQQKVALETW